MLEPEVRRAEVALMSHKTRLAAWVGSVAKTKVDDHERLLYIGGGVNPL